jgi:hypothetical protein
MSLRFQRRIKIAPGVRLNMSLSGISVTTGIKGANLTFGRQGVHANLGLPGSGFSYRKRLTKSLLSKGGGGAGFDPEDVQLELGEDGRLQFFDQAGAPLSESRLSKVRKERSGDIDGWLEARVAELNADRDRVLDLHLDTPPPRPPDPPPPADGDLPPEPEVYKPGLMESLLANASDAMAESIERKQAESEAARAAWQERREALEARRALDEATRARIARVQSAAGVTEPAAMEGLLAAALSEIPWPRETEVSFEIRGGVVWLDVDLPEIEDMPSQEAEIRSRPRGVKLVDRSERAVRQDYMRHVHAVGFRLIGEVFQALPAAQGVVLSAYTQRVDPATGREVDTYLYSVKAPRGMWDRVDFDRLEFVDPVAAIGGLEHRREMSKTGIFKPITPFSDDDG